MRLRRTTAHENEYARSVREAHIKLTRHTCPTNKVYAFLTIVFYPCMLYYDHVTMKEIYFRK